MLTTEGEAELRWKRGNTSQRGRMYRSLCGDCNVFLGTRYNRAYVEFAKSIAEAGTLKPWSRIAVTVERPLRVLKTAVQCFLSSIGSEFADGQPWARAFLLNPDARNLPDVVGVWAYALCYGFGKTTGPVTVGDFEHHMPENLEDAMANGYALAEFAFWPVGLLLTGSRVERLLGRFGLLPLHPWQRFGYKEVVRLTAELPVLPTATPFPVDFATLEEVERRAAGALPWVRDED